MADDLDALAYRELQKLAICHGVKACGRRSDLLSALLMCAYVTACPQGRGVALVMLPPDPARGSGAGPLM